MILQASPVRKKFKYVEIVPKVTKEVQWLAERAIKEWGYEAGDYFLVVTIPLSEREIAEMEAGGMSGGGDCFQPKHQLACLHRKKSSVEFSYVAWRGPPGGYEEEE